MKKKYPIQVIDLRFQNDHNNPKKIQLFEGDRGAANIATLSLFLSDIEKLKWYLMVIKLLKLIFHKNEYT